MIYSETPIQKIEFEAFEKAGVQVFVKREDQNHPFASGNKWWKLKYNLEAAKEKKFDTLLTFGGAYSNHIFATAAAAHESGLKSIGIIRGERTEPLNPTLRFAISVGMHLEFVTREDYKSKTTEMFVQHLHQRFGEFFLIPEGGTNMLAVKGCAEFASENLNSIDFDTLFLPVGTGGTISGLACGFEGNKKILGVSVLRGSDFLSKEVEKLTQQFAGKSFSNWSLLTDYHHGGYAKTTPELLHLIKYFASRGLPLDHVYTGKMMWAIAKEMESGKIERGSTVLALHTGGLQGSQHVI